MTIIVTKDVDVDDDRLENNDEIDNFTIFAFLNSSRILSMLALESPERFIIILSSSSFWKSSFWY